MAIYLGEVPFVPQLGDDAIVEAYLGEELMWSNWVLVTDNPINNSESLYDITGDSNRRDHAYATFEVNIRPTEVYLEGWASRVGATWIGACTAWLYLLNAETNEYEEVAYITGGGDTFDISSLTEGKLYKGLKCTFGGVSNDGSHSQGAVFNITKYYVKYTEKDLI